MKPTYPPIRGWRGSLLALLVASVVGSFGCAMSGSNNPNNSNHGSASIVVSDTSLDFGNVTVGGNKTMSLMLTNSTPSGGPSITLAKVTASGTGFSTPSLSGVDLAPGDSLTIDVKFAPTSAGAKTGSLALDVSGASDPATVPLTGDGVASGASTLSISPSSFAFGTVQVGGSKNLSGKLTAGNANVKISSASWNGSGYNLSGITFPVTVQSGKSVSFTVTFTPQTGGGASGSVSFLSDVPNSPTKANFSGTGALQHTVSLSWAASQSAVAGYNVYRGTKSGGPYSRLNSSLQANTSYSDSSVLGGTTYYYVATAVDSSFSESSYSNEVTAPVPSP